MVQKRSKANDICTSNWLENDNEILKELISKVGCKHESWKLGHDLPICRSKDDFAALKLPDIHIVDKKFLKDYAPPCRRIQTVIGTSSYDGDSFGDESIKKKNGTSIIKLVVHFKIMEYKLIRNVKAFNEESLIGNLGGYFGLFLGFALWQLPSFIESLFKLIF